MKAYERINYLMGTDKPRFEIAEWMKLNKVCPKELCRRLEIDDDMILYKMAMECCKGYKTFSCIDHFLKAELGDIHGN